MSVSGRRTKHLGWLTGVLILALVASVLAGTRSSINPVGKVYFGNPRNFYRPAELEASKVFQVIPEYQEWQKLDPSDPRYWTLLDKANTCFIRALVSVARRYDYDLIGEKGFLRGHKLESKVVDITLVVLDEIQRKSNP